MRTLVPALALLGGCVPGSGPATEISWGGYIFADAYVSDALLVSGSVEVLDPGGECLIVDGACALGAPSESTEGYWNLTVPPTTDVAVRVSGDGLAPAVWRSSTPSRTAQWLSGGIFGRDLLALDAFAEGLGLPGGPPVSLSAGEVAWMWGAPLDPTAWAGADIQIFDGDGEPAAVYAFEVTPDGAYSPTRDGPVSLFVAFDLAPGAVTLDVQAADGRSFQETWPLRGGDLAAANFVALPSE